MSRMVSAAAIQASASASSIFLPRCASTWLMKAPSCPIAPRVLPLARSPSALFELAGQAVLDPARQSAASTRAISALNRRAVDAAEHHMGVGTTGGGRRAAMITSSVPSPSTSPAPLTELPVPGARYGALNFDVSAVYGIGQVDDRRQALSAAEHYSRLRHGHVERVIYNRYQVAIAGSIPVQSASGETKLPFRIEGEIDQKAVRSRPRTIRP